MVPRLYDLQGFLLGANTGFYTKSVADGNCKNVGPHILAAYLPHPIGVLPPEVLGVLEIKQRGRRQRSVPT